MANPGNRASEIDILGKTKGPNSGAFVTATAGKILPANLGAV